MSKFENHPESKQPQVVDHLTERLGQSALEGLVSNEPDFEYELLQLEQDPERSKQLQRSYILNTKRLVEKIERFQPDYVVFLDKSARPVSWLLKELWSDLASEDSQLPAFRYLNIDREQWRHKVGGSEIGSGQIKFDQVEREIKALRNLFTLEQDRGKPPTEQTTHFSGKRVLVVDEVEVSGDTRRIAHGFLEKAFPDATEIADHTWMSAKAARAVGLPDIPTWYRQNTALGRGVADRSEAKSRDSKSAAQRRGWMFLSTRPEGRDAQAERYREEIKHLAHDWRTGKLAIN